MTTERPSKAEIRRRVREHNADDPEPPPLPEEIAQKVDDYQPECMTERQWEHFGPFIVDTIRRYQPTSYDMTCRQLTALSAYVAWAVERDYDLDRQTLLDVELIEAFIDTADLGDSAASNYRSRLRGVTKKVNPSGAKPTASVSVAHSSVQPPYLPPEVTAMVRIARTQPSKTMERQMCVCVGLGFGAGFASVDLKPMYGRHVHDHGDEGIEVETPDVGGVSRPRKVWVRRGFESLVRRGTEGVRPHQLLTGESENRRNVAGKVFENARILGDAPHFSQSRMRTTWLADLLRQGVPLPVIMDAAGLSSARTLTDLVPMLDLDVDVPALLRGDVR